MPDDVLVGDRLTWANAEYLRAVSNLRASWEVSRLGLMSFEIQLTDLPQRWAKPEDLMRKWCTWSHPTAGTWGGVITNISVQNGTVAIDAESWASMLRGIVTWGITKADIFAGLAEIINNTSVHTGITFGGWSTNSPTEDDNYPVANSVPGEEFFTNGQDIYDSFLPAIMAKLYDDSGWRASLRGLGWLIDPVTRVMTMDFTVGRNRLQSVHLVDRVNSVNSGWSDDIDEVYNWVLLSGRFNVPTTISTFEAKCTKWKKDKPQTDNFCINWINVPAAPSRGTAIVQGSVIAIDQESLNEWGPRQVMISRDITFTSQQAMYVYATMIAARMARNQQLVTIELNDENGIFADFREGDIVFASMSNNAWHGRMVVRTRAYDATTGTMTVSGEAERSWE